jgi:phosphatidylserine/phosphatidylglycerophosphate/cardiolipin synthase-like enzyme
MRTLRMLQLLTASVEQRLWITDAYFLSMPILTQSLMAAARDGVDVRVLVPATNDLALIGALSRTGYQQFLEAGVRIFEYGGPMIHAKTLVADGWWSKVGSTNLNLSSLYANWEIDLVAEGPGFASKMEQLFEEDLAGAREVQPGPDGARREGAAGASDRHRGSPGASERRGQWHWVGGHPRQGGERGPPEERRPAQHSRTGPIRGGQWCPARIFPARRSFPASRRLAVGGCGRPVGWDRGTARRPLGALRRRT